MAWREHAGTGAPRWAIDAVLDYLRMHFPDDQVDHVPEGDGAAERFRVVRHGEAAHQLRLRRQFFDAQPDPDGLTESLVRSGAALRMMRVGAETVEPEAA